MAIGVKVCKVCGKEYEACHTLRPNMNSEFRWQDVACCPEHGAEYLRRILISRGQLAEEPAKTEEAAPKETEQPAAMPKKRRTKKKDSGAAKSAGIE